MLSDMTTSTFTLMIRVVMMTTLASTFLHYSLVFRASAQCITIA